MDNLPYGGGWHARLSKNLVRFSDEYSIECWGMEKTIKAPVSLEKGGIIYRVFPSVNIKYIGEVSFPLLRELSSVLKDRPAIVHVHGIFNYTSYLIPLLLKNRPIVMQHHGDVSSLQVYSDKLEDNRLTSLLYVLLYIIKFEWIFERAALSKTDKFFVLHDKAYRYLSRSISESRIEKLSMGIDFNRFVKMDRDRCRKVLNLQPDKKYILYVGAFVKRKGVDYLVRAFSEVLKQYPDCVLLLVGYDSNYKHSIEQLISDLGLGEHVLFKVAVSDHDLPLYYSASDVCVLPSLNEGLPIVGIEALACEVPFIATDVGGTSDLMGIFKAGTILPPKNHTAIANAIIAGFNGGYPNTKPDRINAIQFYSWDRIVDRTLKVYEDLWKKYY